MSNLKANISSRFVSQDVITAFSIFDPKKVPAIDSPDIKTYGELLLSTLISHFGVTKLATTLTGSDCVKEAIVSDEAIIEWKNYRRYLAQNKKKIRSVISLQN